MHNVFLIPARGGSKGVPRKNIRKIRGVPLIAYSINTVFKYDKNATIFVLTDDVEISDISEEYGAICPYIRSQETSSDFASTELVIDEFLCWAEKKKVDLKNIIVLQPTSPIRYVKSIAQSLELLKKYDSVLSVCLSHAFNWQLRKGVAFSTNYDYCNRPRRQDVADADKMYRETGSIYGFRVDGYKESKNRLFGSIGLLKTAEEESFEIDTEFDFKLLNFLINEYFNDI